MTKTEPTVQQYELYIEIQSHSGCPKSLEHFLKPHISKTTMNNGTLGKYLERKNLGYYFDTISLTSCATNLYIDTS